MRVRVTETVSRVRSEISQVRNPNDEQRTTSKAMQLMRTKDLQPGDDHTLTTDVDWLNAFDVAFWLASFDADPQDFRQFLRTEDPIAYRIVTTRYGEYLRVRRRLRMETSLLLNEHKKKIRIPLHKRVDLGSRLPFYV